MRGRTRVSQISNIAVLLALLVTPVWSFAGMVDVPFHGDEAQNIYMARYFDLFFLKRDFSNRGWRVYWARTHPPVSKYLIGLALFTTGQDPSEMDQPWRWKDGVQTNLELGRVPSDSALIASRALMTCLFTLSIVLCAAVAYRLSGFVGALVAGPAFAISGKAHATLRRATPDAPLMFFGMLAVVSSIKLLQCLQSSDDKASRTTLTWAALTGLWLGLAGGSKLSAASLIPMVLLPPAVSWFVANSRGTSLVPGRRVLAVYAVVITVTAVTFVIPNPTLYENPLDGIDALIGTRQSQANIQQQAAPEAALTTVPSRVRAMVDRVFHPVGLVVFLAGLGLIAWQEFRNWTRRAVTGRTVVLLWVAGTLAFTALLTPMNWGRYFVPLLSCQAVILGYLAASVVGMMRKRWNASPALPGG